MNWVSTHPYLASCVSAIVLLVVGSTVVLQKTATTPLQYQPSTWAGTGGVTASPVGGDNTGAPQNPALAGNNSVIPYHYVSPFGTQPSGTDGAPAVSDDDPLSQLASMIQKPASGTADGNTDPSDAYSFIPNGLISIPDTSTKDTPAQAALRSYGNDIGAVIQSFEQSNPDQVAILKNFMEDRNDPDKAEAMRKLGGGLNYIGTLIEQESPVPSQMKAPQAALAAGYHEIGKLLAAIPDAKGDDNVYNAIVTYDSAAERFVGSFVNFALIFPASGVNFSQDESGSIFMFQQSGGGL